MTGRFAFEDMTIQVEEYRSKDGDVSYWLRRIDSPMEVTVGVKRDARPVAVANDLAVDAEALESALSEFLAAS